MILEPFIMEYKNDKHGFQPFFLMFVTFQYGGLHHLDMYCTLIIEA